MSEDMGALYERADGSPVKGYLLLKSQGKNIPISWALRYQENRKKKEKEVKKILQNGNFEGYEKLIEWEKDYLKEMSAEILRWCQENRYRSCV
jgi:hypothetical protein